MNTNDQIQLMFSSFAFLLIGIISFVKVAQKIDHLFLHCQVAQLHWSKFQKNTIILQDHVNLYSGNIVHKYSSKALKAYVFGMRDGSKILGLKTVDVNENNIFFCRTNFIFGMFMGISF